MVATDPNEWHDKEFECHKEPMSMMFGWCCALCMICDSAKRSGQSVPLACLVGSFCPICAVYKMRKDLREKYGIEGDVKKDVGLSACCGACVNIQVNKEIKKREPEAEGLF